jgi:plasmid maintenance system antidote protein VapI
MSQTPKPTMTELLREALAEAHSLYAVGKATGVQKASLIRFARGEQSLRLDMADKLAAYFGLTLTAKRKGRGGA